MTSSEVIFTAECDSSSLSAKRTSQVHPSARYGVYHLFLPPAGFWPKPEKALARRAPVVPVNFSVSSQGRAGICYHGDFFIS